MICFPRVNSTGQIVFLVSYYANTTPYPSNYDYAVVTYDPSARHATLVFIDHPDYALYNYVWLAPAVWSPNGDEIAFVWKEASITSIRVIQPNGTMLRNAVDIPLDYNNAIVLQHDLTWWAPQTTCEPSGFAQAMALSPGCAEETPIPSPTPTIEQQLAEYGVTLANNGRNWTQDEKQAILDGVNDVATAFWLISSETPQHWTRAQIFQNIMGPITFVRSSQQLGYCKTDNNTKTTTCYGDIGFLGDIIPITKYTIAHELGHTFDVRALTNQKKRLVDYMSSGVVVGDCFVNPENNKKEPQRVMGEITDKNGVVISPWTRGERGWGSGPAKKRSTGDSPLVTTFQQDPLLIDFQKTQGSVNYEPNEADAKPRRVEEAAADMFLNWVYRRLSSPAPADPCSDTHPGSWNGFLNATWAGKVSTTPITPSAGEDTDDATNPGSNRFVWMDSTMNSIFLDHPGW